MAATPTPEEWGAERARQGFSRKSAVGPHGVGEVWKVFSTPKERRAAADAFDAMAARRDALPKLRQAMNDAIWKARREYEEAGGDLGDLERDLSSAADGLWLTDYREHVARLLADLRERDADEDLSDAIWEECDGSSFVIYNAQALRLLSLSDNRDAHDEENGEAGASENVRAFYALKADLYDAIRDAGGDPNARTVGDAFKEETDEEE